MDLTQGKGQKRNKFQKINKLEGKQKEGQAHFKDWPKSAMW